MLRSSVIRAAGSASASLRQTLPAVAAPLSQVRQAHAISNPTLANIEKRWESMPPQEQADLWMALRDRMKTDWNELTLNEKKAGTFSWDSTLDSTSHAHTLYTRRFRLYPWRFCSEG